MLIGQMPIVKTITDAAENEIFALIGEKVKIAITLLPLDGSEAQLLFLSDLVSNEFKVSWQAMKGNKRYTVNGLVDARHVFMYISHVRMGFSSGRVGEYINRDHSTVLYGCKKIKDFIDTQDPVINKVIAIIQQLSL